MKKKKRAPGKPIPRKPPPPPPHRWRSWLLLGVLVTLPAVLVDPAAKESFRLPKLFASEILGLASLLWLAWRLRRAQRVELRGLLRQPVMLAVLPLVAVAAGGLLTSDHPHHVRQALASLLVAAACLVGWSLALRNGEHRRVLVALLVPAALLSAAGIAQFHGWVEIFRFQGLVQERIAVTSLAGGAFDLAAYLVLPLLVAQAGLFRETRRRRRWLWVAALALGLYAVALTQTLTAIAALVLGSFVLWLGLLPWRRVVAVTALAAALGAGLGWSIGPLRQRLDRKLESLAAGDLNHLLTGRLDGWWAALWMLDRRPWTGVGHGAYRAEFGDARLALSEAGRRFYRRQHQTYFSNAHSEPLEAAAEWGAPGCLALAWALGVLLWRLRSRRRSAAAGAADGRQPEEPADAALMVAGAVALAALAAANFPLRIALVAYPQLLLLSWIFAPREDGAAGAGGGSAPGSGTSGGGKARRRRGILPAILLAALAVALVLELRQAAGRLRASHQLAAVEEMTRQLAGRGLLSRRPLPPEVRRALERNADLLLEAAARDPVEVGIPIARGAQLLLLGHNEAAIRAYEEALRLEARAEIYANLGRARYLSGDRDRAREAFIQALKLDRNVGPRFRAYLQELGLRPDRRLPPPADAGAGEG